MRIEDMNNRRQIKWGPPFCRMTGQWPQEMMIEARGGRVSDVSADLSPAALHLHNSRPRLLYLLLPSH